jgi:hypothetical protein
MGMGKGRRKRRRGANQWIKDYPTSPGFCLAAPKSLDCGANTENRPEG